MRKISILGSTGSIGTQTLDVIRNLKNAEDIKVCGLSTNQNIDLIEKQIYEFHPSKVAVMDEEKAFELKKRLRSSVEVLAGIDGLIEIATMEEIDTVVTSVVGTIGLIPTFEAIRRKKNIALANKETLVTAGQIIMEEARKNDIKILPVDSEHSAIFQCLQGNKQNPVQRIILTASGGPFRNKSLKELKNVTVEDALKHPNWSMGAKITVDSSTMMNKGLEVIEAKWLFNIELSQIEVVVHPQSMIHSMVEFEDGSIIAQIGEPDMRVPIQYALTFPKRYRSNWPKVDFTKRNIFSFEQPDLSVFKCLQLAYDALAIGGSMPAVLNAANEIAVEKFLKKEIHFLDIPIMIEKAMEAHNTIMHPTLSDILDIDQWAREFTKGR
ncbi:MAG: 1-deoxy-D-xylulose-5-phosphate reductoisomerase [Epulopiscium sp.]|uniref:1-deoxy-D-xylulose-5-phosphate reductoisomerase n=1 Tax=Defluviitalea raffinosedens TaxID=1450156 RepID=UPI001958E91E|nr:1-deoxy-D-xylulose-5-phosphate reductoisomerase [Defluviitalea raffinosedens]MBM7685168.1 1-deoxy-D-xylulose-5-phosphate reductoisomerase [Defluviitalea raffinosedens]MDK2787186.1 1-deoxy-D-xylulose-5-phosphate reductoisomerase [Candidatus Epulonipiscium sp.]